MKKKIFSLVLAVLTLINCSGLSAYGAVPPPLENKFIRPSGKQIIALFDSSEQTSKENNEIKWHLEESFRTMGFELVYHDIHKGLPSRRLMDRARGIVTWYTDSQMEGAAAYCRWLAEQIKSGKKLVIMDNFGAYQDSKTKVWIDMNTVNEVFRQLGVEYKADWTSDGSKLEVKFKDSAIVEKAGPIDLHRIGHYYFFEKVDDSVREHLTVSRIDRQQAGSAVIFSHPKGGMALSRYLMTLDQAGRIEVPNIDFARFLRECFGHESTSKAQQVLVVWEEGPDKAESRQALENIAWVLRYSKINYGILRLKELGELTPLDLMDYGTLVLYTPNLWKLEDPTSLGIIKNYVNLGGGLLVVYGVVNETLNDVFGIAGQGSKSDVSALGLRFTELFFPAAEFVIYSEKEFSPSILDLSLTQDVRVLARSLSSNEAHPDGVPIAWLYSFGSGRVVFWNADVFHLKDFRGVLLQSLLLTQPVFTFFFANVETIHVDDCPQPMYDVYKEPVKSTLGLTDTDFYLNIWWSGILDLAQRYGIQYSFYAIFSYNDKTSPPFSGREFTIGKNGASSKLAKKILENNFELGLHGYSHEPLMVNGRKGGWKSKKNMKEALITARNLWAELFPDVEQPFSFVAPMNVIGREGKEALHEVFPSLKVLSTVLADFDEAYKDAAILEFGPDRDVPELFNIPRVTSGYVFSQTFKNSVINNVNTLGVWTHFIHPDDIFGRFYEESIEQGVPVNSVDWDTVFRSLDSLIAFVRNNYPWLRNFSTKDAFYELKSYFEENQRVRIEKDIVTVNFSSGSRASKYFGIKINDGSKISEMENCRLLHSYASSNTFLFVTEFNNAKIRLTH